MTHSVEQILSAEASFFRALEQSNVEALDSLLDEQFVIVDLSGAELTKQVFVALIGSQTLQFASLQWVGEPIIRIYGETAIVTGRTEMVGSYGEMTFNAASRYTHVYAEVDGQLKFVSAQGTPVTATST